MSLFGAEYQGGPFFELLGCTGKDPLQKWRCSGPRPSTGRSFDETAKGSTISLPSAAVLALPKDEKDLLGCIQSHLLIQTVVGQGAHFSISLVIADFQGTKRRILLSTSTSGVVVNPLHCRLPFPIRKGIWLNLSIDVAGITRAVWGADTGYRSLEGIVIGGVCKVRRVFTMKNPISDDEFGGPTNGAVCDLIPRALDFPAGVEFSHQLIDAERIMAAGGAGPGAGAGGAGGGGGGGAHAGAGASGAGPSSARTPSARGRAVVFQPNQNQNQQQQQQQQPARKQHPQTARNRREPVPALPQRAQTQASVTRPGRGMVSQGSGASEDLQGDNLPVVVAQRHPTHSAAGQHHQHHSNQVPQPGGVSATRKTVSTVAGQYVTASSASSPVDDLFASYPSAARAPLTDSQRFASEAETARVMVRAPGARAAAPQRYMDKGAGPSSPAQAAPSPSPPPSPMIPPSSPAVDRPAHGERKHVRIADSPVSPVQGSAGSSNLAPSNGQVVVPVGRHSQPDPRKAKAFQEERAGKMPAMAVPLGAPAAAAAAPLHQPLPAIVPPSSSSPERGGAAPSQLDLYLSSAAHEVNSSIDDPDGSIEEVMDHGAGGLNDTGPLLFGGPAKRPPSSSSTASARGKPAPMPRPQSPSSSSPPAAQGQQKNGHTPQRPAAAASAAALHTGETVTFDDSLDDDHPTHSLRGAAPALAPEDASRASLEDSVVMSRHLAESRKAQLPDVVTTRRPFTPPLLPVSVQMQQREAAMGRSSYSSTADHTPTHQAKADHQEKDDDDLELVFDPVLGLFYHVATNRYFEYKT